MRIRSREFAPLACLWLAIGSLSAGGAPTADEIATSLIESAEATVRACDESAAARVAGVPVACAFVKRGWGPVKSAQRALHRDLPELHKMSEFSTNLDGIRQSYLLAADGAIGVAFHLASKTLIVFRHHPCWKTEELKGFEVAGQVIERGTTPTHKTVPDYPEKPRLSRSGGTVVYHALVRADGTIEDLCTVHSTRRGMGFEQAGLDAVRDWRYEKREQGRLLPILVDWNIQ